MTALIQTFIVRTLHSGTSSSNAFIVPIEIDAWSHEDAAAQRFNMLSTREKTRTRALLVEHKLCGSPHLYEVKKVTTPQYTITAA